MWCGESPFQPSEPLQRKPSQLASLFSKEIFQTSTSSQCPQTEESRALNLQLELLLQPQSIQEKQPKEPCDCQTPQIQGFQVVPWPPLAETGHGRMVHALLHHGLPETAACECHCVSKCPQLSLSPLWAPLEEAQHPSRDAVAAWTSGALHCPGHGHTSSQSPWASAAHSLEEQSGCYQIYILMAAKSCRF